MERIELQKEIKKAEIFAGFIELCEYLEKVLEIGDKILISGVLPDFQFLEILRVGGAKRGRIALSKVTTVTYEPHSPSPWQRAIEEGKEDRKEYTKFPFYSDRHKIAIKFDGFYPDGQDYGGDKNFSRISWREIEEILEKETQLLKVVGLFLKERIRKRNKLIRDRRKSQNA